MMARRVWQESSGQIEKKHYKLYKAGKFWLVGSISTVALLGGLFVSAPRAHAATVAGVAESVSDPVADSATVAKTVLENTQPNEATPSSTAATVTGAKPASSMATSGATPASSSASSGAPLQSTATKPGSSAAAPASVAAPAGATSKDNSEANEKVSSAPSTAGKIAVTPDSNALKVAAPAFSRKQLLRNFTDGAAVPDTAVTPMLASLDSVAETIDGDVITAGKDIAPVVTTQESTGEYNYANFFVTTKSKYTLYNATAAVTVYPYNPTNMSTTAYGLNSQLWGFYIILPTGITSSLANAQSAATDFVEMINTDAVFQLDYTDFSSLTAYRLNNTNDGRQVYYFRPNDGAKISRQDKTSMPKFQLTLHTGSAEDTSLPAAYNINAQNYADLATDGVLFAGTGNLAVSTVKNSGSYPTITTASLGIDAPDANIAGLVIPNGNRGNIALPQLTYVHVNVTDTYNIVDGTTGQALGSVTSIGQDGSMYQRGNVISLSALATSSLKLDTSKYSDAIAVSSGTATDTMTYTPSVADSTTLAVQGSTYTVYLNELATGSTAGLSVAPKSILAGTAWTPATNLISATDTDGSAVPADRLNVTITDADGNSVSALDSAPAGNYKLVYNFTDADNVARQATTTLTVKSLPITLTVQDANLFVGESWQPADGFVSGTDENGTALTVSQLAVTYAQVRSDGTTTPVESLSTTEPGTYQVTYTYTDSADDVSLAKMATVTVAANQANLNYTDQTTKLYVGGNWAPAAVTATDVDGTAVVVSPVITDAQGNVVAATDVTKSAGTYTVTYSFTDQRGTNHSATNTLTVAPNQSNLNYADTTTDLTVGDAWTPAPIMATDVDGSLVTVTPKITTIDGQTVLAADVTKTPGTYHVTYTFTDQNGQVTTATNTITVTAKTDTGTGTTTPGEGTSGSGTGTTTPAETPGTTPAGGTETGQQPGTKTPVTKPIKRTTPKKPLAATTGGVKGTKAVGLWEIHSTAGQSANLAAAQMVTAKNLVSDSQPVHQTTGSATQLPQTSDDSQSWLAVLGSLSLGLLGLARGLDRKRQN
ncbi:bacterial Ig-like domain-containing protein [Levilactobacillus tongjiangensis]|uniref:Bacterial Ig-like domain-containing protein n=1 Tax=Levilactobacillus tongjiangensis TaxID=2486023 RepID=A0ABW1SPG2_9LACO|nr:bacterial Ig-like domain-containing protein [Levilactobacillus tongjiangensis]